MEGLGKRKDGRDESGVNAPYEAVVPRDNCCSHPAATLRA